MASSKEAAGSEPEREKKTEASEDSGEPFKFFVRASALERWSKPGASLPEHIQEDPSERAQVEENIRRWKQLPQRERRKRVREDRQRLRERRQDDQRAYSKLIQNWSRGMERFQQQQSELEKRKASLQEVMTGDISDTRRREVEGELLEVERRIQEMIKLQEQYQKMIDENEQDLQRTSRKQDEESRQYLAEAIKKGVIEVHLVKCVISGVAGAGKTCLELLLLGKKPPKVRRSTGCAEPIRAVSGTRIQFFDEGWKVVSEEDLEDMIAHSIPIFCDNLDEDIPAEQLEYLLQQQLSSDTTQDKATPTSQDQATPTPKRNTTPSTEDKTSSSPSEAPQQATTSVLNDLIKRMNKVALPEVSDSDSDTSDDGAKESEKLKDLSGSNWIHLIDSGGQPEFYDLLPIFIRHASSIVFVQRLCDSLKDHPVVEFYNDEGKLVGVRYRYPLTCEEILKCMVRTLHSHPTEGKHSNIMVAGTFRDKEMECSETRAEKNEMLFNLLHPHFPNDLVLYGETMKPIFPLNTKHPDEDDQRVAQLLREAIEHSAPDPVKIPISWYLLELALRRLAALLSRKVLSRSECLVIAQQLDFSEEEFNSALTYFDELNLCLHYPLVLPDVVFTDPQVALDKASELVQHSYKLRGAKQGKQPQKPQACTALDAKWLKFCDQGIIQAEFLKKFPRHYKEGLFTTTHLLHLFKHLLILAPLSEGKYFMPSLLQRLPSEELDAHRVSSPAAAPLLVHFPYGWPRNGVFCCLVVFLINHCKWQVMLPSAGSPILMTKNCIKFRVPKHPATITMIDSYAYFEIHIKAPPKVCHKICPRIREVIFHGIDKATDTLHYDNDKPCSGFFCPHSNSNGQANNSELHAATTEDQEYWQCTVEDHFGELTEREKVWFGSKEAAAGVDTIDSFSGEQQHSPQLLPPPSQEPPYHQPSHQHTQPSWGYRQETCIGVTAPDARSPSSAVSAGARSQLHSSTMTGGYVQQVPYPQGGAQTQHSQLGYVLPQSYQQYPQHPTSFPVGPTHHQPTYPQPLHSPPGNLYPPQEHPPPTKILRLDSSHHASILPHQYTGASVQQRSCQGPKPTQKQLLQQLYNTVSDKWRPIGIYLEIPDAQLNAIDEKNRGDPQKCLMAMLTEKWLPRISPPATWQDLAEAVEFVGYPDVAQSLRNKFCS